MCVCVCVIFTVIRTTIENNMNKKIYWGITVEIDFIIENFG